jgi:hypothetical protein
MIGWIQRHAHPQMDHDPDQNGTNFAGLEELTHGRTQAEDGEPQEQQRQEAAVDAMREAEDDDGSPLRGEQDDTQRQDSVEVWQQHPPFQGQRPQS